MAPKMNIGKGLKKGFTAALFTLLELGAITPLTALTRSERQAQAIVQFANIYYPEHVSITAFEDYPEEYYPYDQLNRNGKYVGNSHYYYDCADFAMVVLFEAVDYYNSKVPYDQELKVTLYSYNNSQYRSLESACAGIGATGLAFYNTYPIISLDADIEDARWTVNKGDLIFWDDTEGNEFGNTPVEDTWVIFGGRSRPVQEGSMESVIEYLIYKGTVNYLSNAAAVPQPIHNFGWWSFDRMKNRNFGAYEVYKNSVFRWNFNKILSLKH